MDAALDGGHVNPGDLLDCVRERVMEHHGNLRAPRSELLRRRSDNLAARRAGGAA